MINLDDIQPAGLEQQPADEIKSRLDKIRDDETKNMQQTERILDPMTLLKPIGYLSALVVAFLFVFIFPGSGTEQSIIPVIASLLGYFGLTDWRTNFDNFEAWFKSKTIVGALIVVVPVIGLVIVALIGVAIPGWLTMLLGTLVTLGGGTSILGVFDAYRKAK